MSDEGSSSKMAQNFERSKTNPFSVENSDATFIDRGDDKRNDFSFEALNQDFNVEFFGQNAFKNF